MAIGRVDLQPACDRWAPPRLYPAALAHHPADTHRHWNPDAQPSTGGHTHSAPLVSPPGMSIFRGISSYNPTRRFVLLYSPEIWQMDSERGGFVHQTTEAGTTRMDS